MVMGGDITEANAKGSLARPSSLIGGRGRQAGEGGIGRLWSGGGAPASSRTRDETCKQKDNAQRIPEIGLARAEPSLSFRDAEV